MDNIQIVALDVNGSLIANPISNLIEVAFGIRLAWKPRVLNAVRFARKLELVMSVWDKICPSCGRV